MARPVTSKPLQVLFITPYFYPAWAYGGIARASYELAVGLAAQGHQVRVLATDVLDRTRRYTPPKNPEIHRGIEIHYLRNLSNRLAYRHNVFLPPGTAAALRALPPGLDVIHLHGCWALYQHFVRRYALRNRIPYVVSAHGTAPIIESKHVLKRVYNWLVGDAVRWDASGFIAVSEAERAQYADLGIPAARCRVIYNGVDREEFLDLPAPGHFRKAFGIDGEYVFFLAKITPRKGLDVLLRAFSGLPAELRLVVAGNFISGEREAKALAGELGIRDRVHFVGPLDGKDKLAGYRDARLTAYPAIHEIFGLVPFESLLCGTPVVVTNDCGCGEIIGGNDLGSTVTYGDADGLRAAIRHALAHPEEGASQVERGRAFVAQRLDWTQIARETAAYYEEVSAGGQGRRSG